MPTEADYSGGRRPADPHSQPIRPAMTDTLAKIRDAEVEARRVKFDASGTDGRTRPSDEAETRQPAPKVKRPEDPIRQRIETHRGSISKHEKAIVEISSTRDISVRKLRGELEEMTRAFEDTRDLYHRVMDETVADVAASLEYHGKIIASDRAAMDSLLGRRRMMVDTAAEGVEQYIARKVEEGIKTVLSKLPAAQVVDPVSKPKPKRKPITPAQARAAVKEAIAKHPDKGDLVSQALDKPKA